MTTTTAYLSDGRHVDVPDDDVSEWQYEVRNRDTTLGLADWYTDQGEERQDEIQGTVDHEMLCDHPELSHRVTNESQIGEFRQDKPCRMARVCHRRACILDAMSWVERGTDEPAAWAAPNRDYVFEVPKSLPEPETGAPRVHSPATHQGV